MERMQLPGEPEDLDRLMAHLAGALVFVVVLLCLLGASR